MTALKLKGCLTALLFCLCTGPLLCQFLTVTDIEIDGNKRTKDQIILRELNFRVGDQIQQSQLAKRMDVNEFQLLSTGLFTNVIMNVLEWDVDADEISVLVSVTESPWIVPIPIFELADRNFNVWWNEFNASFSRVNYGMRLALLNAWGYGERLRLTAQFGYTPKFELSTLLPFLDNNQSVRMQIKATYTTNRETAVFNEDNLRIFRSFEDQRIILRRQEYNVGLIFRPKILATHALRLGYQDNRVDEEFMLQNNENFFLDGRTRQRFISAEYEFEYDKRNLPVQPTTGWLFSMKFVKFGFGIWDDLSATYFEPNFEYYQPIGRRWTASGRIKTKLALERDQQPFYNYRGLGYGDDFIRGYELYVIDGLDYYLGKFSMQYLAWSSALNWGKIMPVKSMRSMPFKVFVAANYDMGYSNDPYYNAKNDFTNRLLYGGGLGVNIMLYNTFLLQVECSVNHLGEKGIFLRTNTAF